MVGYYLEAERLWGIYPLANKATFTAVFVSISMAFKWCRGSRYLGGYYRSHAMSDRFVDMKVAERVHSIKTLTVAGTYLQTVYVGLACSLQLE